jgi:hypothetical protein
VRSTFLYALFPADETIWFRLQMPTTRAPIEPRLAARRVASAPDAQRASRSPQVGAHPAPRGAVVGLRRVGAGIAQHKAAWWLVPSHAGLCHATPRHAMPCYAMLCYAMLCYAMLCYAMPCHAMPCHAMLC